MKYKKKTKKNKTNQTVMGNDNNKIEPEERVSKTERISITPYSQRPPREKPTWQASHAHLCPPRIVANCYFILIFFVTDNTHIQGGTKEDLLVFLGIGHLLLTPFARLKPYQSDQIQGISTTTRWPACSNTGWRYVTSPALTFRQLSQNSNYLLLLLMIHCYLINILNKKTQSKKKTKQH